MSHVSIARAPVATKQKVTAHRVLVTTAIIAAVLIVLAIAAYGFNYYWLSLAERPFSEKHALLKPSGRIGLSLGTLGLSLFLIIFLYPVRKRIPWLARRGSAKHWLDFHVIAGSVAPIVIMLHASFKFQGVAGLAFWCMVAVALSGIVGRYVYAQIPPTLNSAQSSLRQMEQTRAADFEDLSAFGTGDCQAFATLTRMPSAEEIKKMSGIAALCAMGKLDLMRPFLVARVRAHFRGRDGSFAILWGFVPSKNLDLEAAIRRTRAHATLTKRVAFLAKTQQIFHLWHVVHRPFSYSFAALAVIHLIVVFSLGYI
jgi:hypothetical protein